MNGRFFYLCLVFAFVVPCLTAVPAQTTTDAPRVFLLNSKKLRQIKAGIKAKNNPYAEAIASIEKDAQKALAGGTFSVTTKAVTPPSGDKHDYMSQAPYFWADPSKKDALPYIRRDGERNPEINKITDHKSMDQMVSAVDALSLAYYLNGNEAYATKAVQILRAFFLDPATRMNPNLQYAQGIPGINTGRGIGLIETVGLARVVDSIGLLDGSKALSTADKKGLEDWFSRFLQWMQQSKNGQDESAAQNNHGTHYDLQVTSYALFLGKNDLAKSVLEAAKQKRIAKQIEPDGSQPLELARTKAWSYSVMNLRGLMQLATLGTRVRVDLWNYETKDGRSIRRALDFLYPYSIGERWNHQQIGEWQPEILFPGMRMAAAHYSDEKFKSMQTKIPNVAPSARDFLYSALNN
jgi:hypothetical protein